MKSKFEISISTSYVPDWGVTEAMRELFQNALDNETINPENKMYWNYDGDTVNISNKTSTLTKESLLLGNGTKHDETRTIGKHGEGYKIAFMVLLRNGKKIRVYNYGAREIWEVRLVNSRKYNGQQIPTVFIEKEALWKSVPSYDLTIEVEGITLSEYEDIKNKNLHLRKDTVEKYDAGDRGYIITSEEEKGNIYVNGLFVTHLSDMDYGYDFNPKYIKLDRDRRMVSSIDINWEASAMWATVSKDTEMRKKAVGLINSQKDEVRYVGNIYSVNNKTLINAVAEDFYENNGADAVPVTNNEQFNRVKRLNIGNPIIVSDNKAELIKRSDIVKVEHLVEDIPLTDKFTSFLEKIKDKLTEEEVAEFEKLIEQI